MFPPAAFTVIGTAVLITPLLSVIPVEIPLRIGSSADESSFISYVIDLEFVFPEPSETLTERVYVPAAEGVHTVVLFSPV